MPTKQIAKNGVHAPPHVAYITHTTDSIVLCICRSGPWKGTSLRNPDPISQSYSTILARRRDWPNRIRRRMNQYVEGREIYLSQTEQIGMNVVYAPWHVGYILHCRSSSSSKSAVWKGNMLDECRPNHPIILVVYLEGGTGGLAGPMNLGQAKQASAPLCLANEVGSGQMSGSMQQHALFVEQG